MVEWHVDNVFVVGSTPTSPKLYAISIVAIIRLFQSQDESSILSYRTTLIKMKTYNIHPAFSHVEKMVKDKYSDAIYDNSIVMFGYNLPDQFHSLPFIEIMENERASGNRVIIYQLEQLYAESPWVNDLTIKRLSIADAIWDYDMQNIEYLQKNFNLNNIKFRPMLYSDSLLTINHLPDKEKDIDILFYGSLNESRSNLLTNIQKKVSSAKIKCSDNSWGTELEALIARSKIVLNLHFYPINRQEQVRMFFLTINKCCVVSQFSQENYMGRSIFNVNTEDLPDVCANLLEDRKWKIQAQIAGQRYKNISKIHEDRIAKENILK